MHRDTHTNIRISDVLILTAIQIKTFSFICTCPYIKKYVQPQFWVNSPNHHSDVLVAGSVFSYSESYGKFVFFGTCAVIITYLSSHYQLGILQ